MSKLDIIVTHHDEPWSVGKPFFDMLAHQQNVEWRDIHVVLVQDGEEGAIGCGVFDDYPYKVDCIKVCEHSGTATARNVGYKNSSSAWVMFCDFDDMLADVCSLAMLIDHFPTDECDVIWCKCVQMSKWSTGHMYLNKIDEVNFGNTHGKMYRRAFLYEHGIRFCAESKYHYDHIFNAVVLNSTEPFRIMALTTDFYPYFCSFRKDSFRRTLQAKKEMIADIFERNKQVVLSLAKHHEEYCYARAVAKVVASEFCSIYDPETENKNDMSRGFIEFYNTYRDVFRTVSDADMDVIRTEAETEMLNIIQSMYNEHRKEYYFRNDDIPFDHWLADLDDWCDNILPKPEAPEESPQQPIAVSTEAGKKVVVYCGTYDVYLNMVASAKSLLCTTPVDEVYFLIEDDVFPYELPERVHTINIKPLAFEVFDRAGPNFNNAWTYMCMVRALYPSLFPQYDRILSLDIDVVITEDVSDLWDIDLTDYYLAGVPERQRQKSTQDPLYINFGVVMMNLAKLRQDNKQDEIVTMLNKQKVDCPEQTAYNKACAWHILDIPADYNYTTYSHITGDAVRQRIIHYAGQKFWRHYSIVKKYADLPWTDVLAKQSTLKGVTNT